MSELSILFADIADSTSLFEQHGDEKARSAISSVLALLVNIAEIHRGHLVKTIGDEIMCTFDTPEDALNASVEMQMSVSGNFVLGNHPIAIRVGFHHGKVIKEEGDVFGDAVNVAARMTGYAKKSQIITNSLTFKNCQKDQVRSRSLGKSKIKGKLLPVEITEVLWQPDTSQITRISSALDLRSPTPETTLSLSLGVINHTMSDQSPVKTIGRGDDCDIQTMVPMASRLHGEIQYASGNFRYTDLSTNGTWIKMGSDPIRLHRDSMILQNTGAISFGESNFSDEENILYFELNNG